MQRLRSLGSRIQANVFQHRSKEASVSTLRGNISLLEERLSSTCGVISTLDEVKPVIDRIIEEFSEDSIRQLESLLTMGVSRIFDNPDLSVQIVTSDKRNNKSAELFLRDGEYTYPLKNSSVAGGILVVVGFLVQAFFVVNLPVAKVVFLDEAFTQISSQYVSNFMSFVKELSDQTGLIMVLVTHDNRFLDYGDRIYRVEKGKFTLESV